jgi:DNA (cytosine-5)-methyltransferase 1
MPRLKVIDLFCGAGGFSEGFRQSGFEVTHAIDNWNPALVAHKENQPEAEIIKADIASLDPRQFSKPDVIIGGPPCTEFSGSKRGGGGDFAKGMKLVLAYFRFVHVLVLPVNLLRVAQACFARLSIFSLFQCSIQSGRL